jgi:hypothetical protein
LAGHYRRQICHYAELRSWPQVSLVQCVAFELLRYIWGIAGHDSEGSLPVAQPARERDLQFLHATATATATATTASASAATSGDADVPGRIRDSGYSNVPGSAAAAAAATTGARARPLSGLNCEEDRSGQSSGPVFFCAAVEGQSCRRFGVGYWLLAANEGAPAVSQP